MVHNKLMIHWVNKNKLNQDCCYFVFILNLKTKNTDYPTYITITIFYDIIKLILEIIFFIIIIIYKKNPILDLILQVFTRK